MGASTRGARGDDGGVDVDVDVDVEDEWWWFRGWVVDADAMRVDDWDDDDDDVERWCV